MSSKTAPMTLSEIREKISGVIDMAKSQPPTNTNLSILTDTIIGLTEEKNFIAIARGNDQDYATVRLVYETIRDYSKDASPPIKEDVKQELIDCLQMILDTT